MILLLSAVPRRLPAVVPAADTWACSECGRVLVGGTHDSICSKGGGGS